MSRVADYVHDLLAVIRLLETVVDDEALLLTVEPHAEDAK